VEFVILIEKQLDVHVGPLDHQLSA